MKLHYRKTGSGQPLMIVHGLFGSSDNWQTHARSLAERYEVFLVDQRNHGHSPHSPEMNYDVMAEDLLEIVAEEGLRDIVLLGHSMGGKTVMRFAQQHGFLLDKLIVADMGIKTYKRHHDKIFEGLFHVDVEHVKSRKEAEERLKPFIEDPSTVQFLLKNLCWKAPEQLDWRFNLRVLHDRIDDILGGLPDEQIMTETLMIVGGKSGYVPQQDFEPIRELIPNVRFRVLPDAGHWVHAEAPAEFMAAVEEFLQN